MKLFMKFVYNIAKLKWYVTRPISVGVRILLIKDSKVLLVRHAYQDHWYLPGGGVKKGESLEQAIRRECQEEIGGVLGPVEIFGTYSNFFEYKSDHIIVFVCSDYTLVETRNAEIETWDCFDFAQLPHNISPGSLRRIQEYIQKEYPKHGNW